MPEITRLRRYYLFFFLVCFILTLAFGALTIFIPQTQSISSALGILPYLIAMITTLYRFLKHEKRAPTEPERKKITYGLSLVFWGYNLVFMLGWLAILQINNPDVLPFVWMLISTPSFLVICFIIFILYALCLLGITYWFYGKQAKRMAAKLFPAA